jgi:hypothetical protein
MRRLALTRFFSIFIFFSQTLRLVPPYKRTPKSPSSAKAVQVDVHLYLLPVQEARKLFFDGLGGYAAIVPIAVSNVAFD